MDTLEGLLYFETCKGIENWCLAVEDPKDKTKTKIFRCKDQEAGDPDRKFSKKRGGAWKFKAYKFNGKIEIVKTYERSLHEIWNYLPENSFRCFPSMSRMHYNIWMALMN